MSRAADARRMSYPEYLALEGSSETKHEYVNGQVYAMAGGTPEHARLATRIARQLGAALEGRPCDTFSSDLRIHIEATGRSTYPDLAVVCGPLRRAVHDDDAVTNPVVIVEVLSESTESSDRGDEWAHYQRIPSLREYVLVSQHEQRVEVFRRADDGWTYHESRGGSVALRSIDAALDLPELYRDSLAV